MTNHIDIHINENTHLFIPENKNAEEIIKEINKQLFEKHKASMSQNIAQVKEQWLQLTDNLYNQLISYHEMIQPKIKNMNTLNRDEHSKASKRLSNEINPKLKMLFSNFNKDFTSVWPYTDVPMPNLTKRLISRLKPHYKAVNPDISRVKNFRTKLNKPNFTSELIKTTYSFDAGLFKNDDLVKKEFPECILITVNDPNTYFVDISKQNKTDIPTCNLELLLE